MLQEALKRSECCVCMMAPCSTVLNPCGHCCMCVECSDKMTRRGQPCPICRSKILGFLRLFVG